MRLRDEAPFPARRNGPESDDHRPLRRLNSLTKYTFAHIIHYFVQRPNSDPAIAVGDCFHENFYCVCVSGLTRSPCVNRLDG